MVPSPRSPGTESFSKVWSALTSMFVGNERAVSTKERAGSRRRRRKARRAVSSGTSVVNSRVTSITRFESAFGLKAATSKLISTGSRFERRTARDTGVELSATTS